MADDQYENFSKMLDHLEEGAKTAAELAELGQNPIGAEDWADQIKMLNEAIAFGHPDVTRRANALIEQLQRLKP